MVVEDFQARLRAAMDAAGVDAAALAAAIGISYQAVKKALDGKSKTLSAENCFRAADATATNARWLATGEGEMSLSSERRPPAPDLATALPVFLDALRAVPPTRQALLLDRLSMWVRHGEEADRAALEQLLTRGVDGSELDRAA
jgi:transcriptional regulator with XRE-family HTH domain